MASRNNRFDAQITQTDKVLFCLGAYCLSAENGEHASLKSVTKIRHPKILNRKKKKDQLKKTAKKRKKTLPASENKRYNTRLCISISRSVEAIHNEGRGA